MSDEAKSDLNADAQAGDIAAGASQKDDESSGNGSDPLAILSKITGRNFSSVEEFDKHYKNLNSFVGDQTIKELRDKAKRFDELASKSADNTAQPAASAAPATEDKLSKIERQLAVKDFLAQYPEASEVVHLVEVEAQRIGGTLSQAYETSKIKDLVQSKIAFEKVQQERIGVNSKNRIAPTQQKKIQDLAAKAQRGNSDAKEQLVAEVLGL